MCSECLHQEHEPGHCEKCNCGESSITHRTGYAVSTRLPSKTSRFGVLGDGSLVGKAYRNEHPGQK